MTTHIGQITKTWQKPNGYEIRQRVVRVAYARNGNTDNPTIQYAYDVYQHGKRLLWGLRTQSEAIRNTR